MRALRHVIWYGISCTTVLRQLHEPQASIVVRHIDVKDAYRQVPVDPSGASNVRLAGGISLFFVDMRLQVAMNERPGCGFEADVSALEFAPTKHIFVFFRFL